MDSTLRDLLNQNIQQDLSQLNTPSRQASPSNTTTVFLRKTRWWGRLWCSGRRRQGKKAIF